MLKEKEYIIRKIKSEDTYEVLDLVLKFQKEALGKTKVSFHVPTILKLIKSSIEVGMPCIFVALDGNTVVGLIAGVITNSYFDPKQIMAMEIVWIVDESHRGLSIGKQLVQAFEKYAKLKGASMVILIAGHYSVKTYKERALGIFYRRNGYELLETHYVKHIGG